MIAECHTLLPLVKTLAKHAGDEIMRLFDQGVTAVEQKADDTPLTEADLAAHQVLTNGLPEYPMLSEESQHIPFEERAIWQRYWLVDPLDGTKEFLDRNGEFSVNIALIEDHRPILGIIYVPVTETFYVAIANDCVYKQIVGGSQESLTIQSLQDAPLRVTMSRRHDPLRIEKHLVAPDDYTIVRRGSSIKFCLIAEGGADIYFRLGATNEWDTAAGQCILEQAGGRVIDCHGRPLRYNTKASYLNPGFVAIGDVALDKIRCIKL